MEAEEEEVVEAEEEEVVEGEEVEAEQVVRQTVRQRRVWIGIRKTFSSEMI